MTVMLGKEGFEVTTYRIDGKYEDSRHPKEVIFTPNLEEDLKRRDFTINAMAYNDRLGVVDEFDGIGDLSVRFNGDMHPTDVGVYLSLAVSYDSNYETAYCVDYLVIAPKTVQADLEFNMSDSNGLISADLIKDGFFDLGASAYIDGEKDAAVTEDIGHLFVTVNLNGEFSYVQALKSVGKDIKDYQKATIGTQHKFLDLRFENERLAILVECKNKFSKSSYIKADKLFYFNK